MLIVHGERLDRHAHLGALGQGDAVREGEVLLRDSSADGCVRCFSNRLPYTGSRSESRGTHQFGEDGLAGIL